MRLRRFLFLALLVPIGLSCEPEEQLHVEFSIHCVAVDGATGQAVVGRMIYFAGYKIDARSQEMDGTRWESSNTTAVLDPRWEPYASFQLGYNLHRKGSDEESAVFECGTSSPVSEGRLVISYSDAEALLEAGEVVEKTIRLTMPAR